MGYDQLAVEDNVVPTVIAPTVVTDLVVSKLSGKTVLYCKKMLLV